MDPNQQPLNQSNDPNQAGHRWAPGQNPFLTEPLNNSTPQTPTQAQQPGPQLSPVPSSPQQQPSLQPAATNGVGGNVSTPGSNNGGSRNKILIIATIVVAALVVLIGLLVVALSGGDSSNNDKQAVEDNGSQPSIVQPGTALEIQQISNSITQDISTVDDEKDFPSTSLDDRSLGL